MKIVGLLDHPNVVRAIDADVHEGSPYIVMEYLEGDDLEQVLARRGPLPPNEVIAYMAQASRGLAHAHEKGVIHRDIKPTNVFLVNTGMVKMLDLGFGELVGMAGLTGNVFDTDEGIVVGTTDFMSPEQVKDKPIDARTDLFSLGCTMYRLLTASYAFPGRDQGRSAHQADPAVVMSRSRTSGRTSLTAWSRSSTVCSRGGPADRFSSAAEVAEALEALITPDGRSERGPSKKSATRGPDADAPPLPAEPEAPLDWSLIESALRPKGHGAASDAGQRNWTSPMPRPAKGLSSHRKVLEEEGVESGREVHDQYRNELIQMKRAMTELRSMEPADQATEAGPTWLERIGEWFGDFLAEPSAFQIILVVLAVLFAFVLAMVLALG